MEKTVCPSVGPKVSQIATIFQKKPIEMPQESSLKEVQTNVNVVRTESHAARFNNARALFEKLGVENKGPRTDAFGNRMVHSSSREDILNEESPERVRSPSPKRKQYPLGNNNITNGVTKIESAKIYNVSRIKSEKPEKPEKPERKFNSKELIEKQKNWTSHFTKTRTTRFNSDPNRCDIIRTVPGTTLISGPELFSKEPSRSASFNSKPTELTLESPPSPPIRQPPPPPPEIKPRHIKIMTSPTKNSSVIPINKPQQNFIKTSPTKVNSSNINFDYQKSPTKTTMIETPNSSLYGKFDEIQEKQIINKRSFDEHYNDNHHRYPERDTGSCGVSSSPSASSGPSSPNHTEDEKQENEDTEKFDKILDSDYISEGRTTTTPPTERNEPDTITNPHSNVTIRSKKVTSICLNIPAAGLGSRPPSIISSISTDEGGFNEPIPEIKAIQSTIKPAYPFEPPKYEILTTDYNSHLNKQIISPNYDDKNFDDDDPKLNYVDVGYRLNPDGSESKEIFGETELYHTSIKNSVLEELENEERLKKETYNRSIYAHNTNGITQSGIIYATIKPEIPPPTELLLNFKNNDVIIPPFPDFDGHTELNDNNKIYHSPQTILDPTRPSLIGDENVNNKILLVSPEPPMRPPLPEGPPLDLCDVEYADASDNDDAEDNLPDAMTPDEAERLLSSRQQPLLSDEQAREVEQILSTEIEKNKKITTTTTTSSLIEKPEKDEPDWLKDVLGVPKIKSNELTENDNKKQLNGLIDNSITDNDDSNLNITNDILNQSFIETSSFQESIVSIDSMPSVGNDSNRSVTVSTIDESINSNRQLTTDNYDDNISGINSLNDADISGDDSHQSYIPEYPPVKSKEVHFEGGVHYFEDGNFWMEVPGLMESEVEDEDEDLDYPILVKKNTKVKFSTGPIQVFSTFSVTDYDRRNEDVDPVAASAEYELEKRVEKMDVFPVELMKGPEGLGLSIIGMGVGADAGLEKLGIFIKTITDNGAAARDSRIQVNDQIIEVDGKSLVGVTQAYAASVLRNTSGLVKFLIGRERDPDNSEVAQLIRQSLQADREKEERMKKIYRQQDEYLRRTSEHSEDSTLPASANSSVSEEPLSPTAAMDSLFDAEASHSQEVESLKRLLQENHNQITRTEEENILLRETLVKLESTGNDSELLSERLKQTERELTNIKKEASNYQNMLQQSQAQYMALDKKYNKAKRIVREFQQREIDMVHREEFYQQLLQEKDTEYNALVKKLKDRVIHLEQELEDTQRKAGLPVLLPYESASLKLTPQMTRRQPPKPLFQKLETELSDTEISDLSPDEGKTATVERKIPVKDELDTAVPQHELLDNSASKTKASRGGHRQLPSGKKSLSNSSSDCGLEESEEEPTDSTSISHENNQQHPYTNGHYRQIIQQRVPPPAIVTQNAAPLYAQVHKDRDSVRTDLSQQSSSGSTHSTIPNIYRTSNEKQQLPSSYINDLDSSYDSILGSNDKLSDNGSNSENYSQQNRRPKAFKMPFAEELSQVLAESKGRRTGDGASRESSDDYTELNRPQNPAAILTQNLVVEIRQAVNEAQPKLKNVVPQSLSPPGTVPWQQQNQLHQQQPQGPPSPSSISSGSISPGAYSPSRTLDLSGSSTSFSSDRKAPHYWQNGPVPEWSKDQVCQWLMALGLEKHIPKFLEHGVEGGALLQLDSRDFKILGVNGDDKSKLKRKLKELKHIIEKEKRQMEKDKKEREKLIKKAEKKAEKQAKKK